MNDKLKNIVEPHLAEGHILLDAVEDPRGSYLRIIIDSENSITLEETTSLTKNLKNCLSTKPITRILETYKDGRLYHEIEYRVVEDISLDYGKELAPNIKERFHSIKKIEIRDNGGGSMGSVYRTIIYGVLEINKNKVLLQLKSIDFNIPSQRR